MMSIEQQRTPTLRENLPVTHARRFEGPCTDGYPNSGYDPDIITYNPPPSAPIDNRTLESICASGTVEGC